MTEEWASVDPVETLGEVGFPTWTSNGTIPNQGRARSSVQELLPVYWGIQVRESRALSTVTGEL